MAVGRELAGASIANLEEDPERSVLLGLAAMDNPPVHGTVLPEAEEVNDLAFSDADRSSPRVLQTRSCGSGDRDIDYLAATDSLECSSSPRPPSLLDTIEPITPYSVAIEAMAYGSSKQAVPSPNASTW